MGMDSSLFLLSKRGQECSHLPAGGDGTEVFFWQWSCCSYCAWGWGFCCKATASVHVVLALKGLQKVLSSVPHWIPSWAPGVQVVLHGYCKLDNSWSIDTCPEDEWPWIRYSASEERNLKSWIWGVKWSKINKDGQFALALYCVANNYWVLLCRQTVGQFIVTRAGTKGPGRCDY